VGIIEFNEVILVNQYDEEIGRMEKLEAHQKGLLHRAFSVFIFNDKNELLLQKRANGKYHSEGLWTNTCCSHPSPGESIVFAANRRLKEEMGLSCDLMSIFSFIYNVELENGLYEHELDHIVIGFGNDDPVINPFEASMFCWKSMDEIIKDIHDNPMNYTSWFKIIMEDHLEKINNALKNNNESL